MSDCEPFCDYESFGDTFPPYPKYDPEKYIYSDDLDELEQLTGTIVKKEGGFYVLYAWHPLTKQNEILGMVGCKICENMNCKLSYVITTNNNNNNNNNKKDKPIVSFYCDQCRPGG